MKNHRIEMRVALSAKCDKIRRHASSKGGSGLQYASSFLDNVMDRQVSHGLAKDAPPEISIQNYPVKGRHQHVVQFVFVEREFDMKADPRPPLVIDFLKSYPGEL
jgi:hypothetical protein